MKATSSSSSFQLFGITIFLIVFTVSPTFATTYLINFTGSGGSNSVESIEVRNITRNTVVNISGSNVLKLTDSTTGIDETGATNENLQVYTNFAEAQLNVRFFAKQDGNTTVQVFNIDGRKQTELTQNIQSGNNTCVLTLPKGIFMIRIIGNGYSYATKVVNQTGANTSSKITFIDNAGSQDTKPQKSGSVEVSMYFVAGDQIKYKAYSEGYTSRVTSIPTSTGTVNFDFSTAEDIDENVYHSIKIGNQVWMLENLKTTKYRNGQLIGTTANFYDQIGGVNMASYQWPLYSGYGPNYGSVYTWFVVNKWVERNDVGYKLAPTGWHVPTDAEWTQFADYLMSNGFGLDNTVFGRTLIAKSMASTTDWMTGPEIGTIGNDLTQNNRSGFNALPSGRRNWDGTVANFGTSAWFYSASESDTEHAWSRSLVAWQDFFGRSETGKYYGCAIRCVKD